MFGYEDKLHEALDYAKKIIRAYQEEIMEKGYDKEGFCQGVIFKEAIEDINRKAEF